MRILHISDLHASAGFEADQQRIVEALLKDVHEAHDETPFSFIFFTGDLANAGVSVEFELGRDLLLAPVQELLGLSCEDVFIVPGNHDVNREGDMQISAPSTTPYAGRL